MKKLFLFLAMASTTMFVSCGSDDSDGGAPKATSITLVSSANTAEVGAPVTLTVKNNLSPAVDVTSSSTFAITPATGATVTAGVFTATVAGSYSVVAKNGDLTSAAVVITVAPASAGKYTFDGTTHKVDNMYFLAHGDATAGTLQFVNLGDQVGTAWVGVMFSGSEDDVMTAGEYMEYTFFVPAVDNGDETYTVNLPGEADATLLSVYAEKDLVPFDLEAVTVFSATIDTFELPVTEGTAGTTKNSSKSGTAANDSVITHEYNSEFSGVYLTNLLGSERATSAKIQKPTSKLVQMKDLKKVAVKSNAIKTLKVK